MTTRERSPRVLVAGETLVDLVASDGTFRDADVFHAGAGGAPANVAAGLAGLDEPAWLWTRVGDDGFGQRCRDALANAGVPGDLVEVDGARRTTIAVAAGAADADVDDHAFSFYRDADRYLGDDETETGDANSDGSEAADAHDPKTVLKDVDVVVVGGIALAVEPARSAIFDLLDAAVDVDCTVVFDPNARPATWESGEFETVTARVLERADVVKATPGDLAAAGFDVVGITPGDDDRPPSPDAAPALAREVCERGPHTTFLTLGGEGAAAASTHRSPFGRGGATHYGYDVDAVDPTGAGDAFLAAVVAELAAGATDPYAVLDVATAAGALATTQRGAMPSLPDREAVDALVASDDGHVDEDGLVDEDGGSS